MNRALDPALAVIAGLGTSAPGLNFALCSSKFMLISGFGAISSVVERLLHTQEVAGSNPASRTRWHLQIRRGIGTPVTFETNRASNEAI